MSITTISVQFLMFFYSCFFSRSICKCLNATRFEQRFSDGMQTLQLPHLKNDEIDPEEFTLDHFYKLYTFLCPRQDLDKIFTKM